MKLSRASNAMNAHHSSNRRLRRSLSRFLLFVGLLLILISGPLLYVSVVLEEEDAFVALADDAIAHPEIRLAVAEVVTAVTIEVVTSDETITAGLPDEIRTFIVPITEIASGQLTEGAFAVLDTEIAVDARESALREVHQQLTADDEEIIIDLRAVLVRTSRELGGPAVGAGVAKLVADSESGRFLISDSDSSNHELVNTIRAIPTVGAWTSLGAVVVLLASILVASDRRRALVAAGLVLAGAAFSSTAIVIVILFAVLGGLSGGSSVGLAIAEVISTDFAQHQRGAVIIGLAMAAVGLLAGERPAAKALRALPGDIWHLRPGSLDRLALVLQDNPPLARILVWLSAVGLLVAWPEPTWRVVITLLLFTVAAQSFVWVATSHDDRVDSIRSRFGIENRSPAATSGSRWRSTTALLGVGLFLFWPSWGRETVVGFFVVGATLQATLDLRQAHEFWRSQEAASSHAHVEPASNRRLVYGFALLAVAAVGGTWLTTDSTGRVEESTACNGHIELCERRVNEVVFAGSHNSMSSIDLGWQLAMQEGDMVAQLDAGVRSLLIDALYWDETGSLDGGATADASAVIEAALSDDQPRSGTWLCHGFCALGATDLTAGLSDINSWLSENPREVLLLVVQDEISFTDLEAAFFASGLRDRAFVHEPGTPFPSLGEMIEANERILVYGENLGEPGTWFQNGFDTAISETPFTFAVRTEFSCKPNRGGDGNPLFMINHWLTTGIPVKAAAAVVNSRDVLLERVQTCERERNRLPTILAVDFVETGDLMQVVDELNGINQD